MTTKYTYRQPTTEELYAVEVEARRLRAEVVSQMFRKGARAVRAMFARAVSTPGARTVRHA